MLAGHDALRVRTTRVGQVDEQGQRAAVGKRNHDGMWARQLGRGHLSVVGIPQRYLNVRSDLVSRHAQPDRRVSTWRSNSSTHFGSARRRRAPLTRVLLTASGPDLAKARRFVASWAYGGDAPALLLVKQPADRT